MTTEQDQELEARLINLPYGSVLGPNDIILDIRKLSDLQLAHLHILYAEDIMRIKEEHLNLKANLARLDRERRERYEFVWRWRRVLGINFQHVCHEGSRRKRQRGKDFAAQFVEVASQVLDPALFGQIADEARAKATEGEPRLASQNIHSFQPFHVEEAKRIREANRSRIAATARRTTLDEQDLSVYSFSGGLPSLGKRR